MFPINREKTDIAGVKNMMELLEKNSKIRLLIFPEGKVLKEKTQRGKIKNGAVYVAANTKVPIIPVYITARPKYFTKVTVKFGNPLKPAEECIKNKVTLKNESKRLLDAIYELE